MENELTEVTDSHNQNEASHCVECVEPVPGCDKQESSRDGTSVVHRIIKTVILYTSIFSFGLSQYVLGPAILHMTIIFSINLTTMTRAIIGQGCGSIAGSGLVGVIFARFNPELQLGLACFTMGAATIIAPWTGNVQVFLLSWVFQGVAMGFLGTAGITYCTSLWDSHRLQEPIMQGLWSIWSMGATVAPIVMRQFLVPLENPTTSINNTDTLYQTYSPLSDSTLKFRNHTIMKTDPDIGLVRYGFMVIGFFVVCSSLPYFVLLKILRISVSQINPAVGNDDIESHKSKQNHRIFTLVTLVLLSCYAFFNLCIESIIGSFLTVFVFETLNWSLQRGSLLASTVWSLHALGRLLGVPVSIVMKPRSMIAVNLTLMLIGHVLMAVVSPIDDVFMWISASMIGLGMATNMASTVLFASGYITITAQASAIITVGACLGGVVGPPLTAYVFENYDQISMAYVLVIINVMSILVFVAISIHVWFHKTTTNQKPKNK